MCLIEAYFRSKCFKLYATDSEVSHNQPPYPNEFSGTLARITLFSVPYRDKMCAFKVLGDSSSNRLSTDL